jgi:hypothetical protein
MLTPGDRNQQLSYPNCKNVTLGCKTFQVQTEVKYLQKGVPRPMLPPGGTSW